MKPIHLNLASREYVDRKLAYLAMASVLFLLVSITLGNIFMYRSSRQKVTVYNKKISEFTRNQDEAEAGKASKMTVNEKEIEMTRANTLFVNRIIGKDVFPWERVLNAFENDLPKNIFLESFQPDSSFNRIILKGYATSMSEVSTYLKGKEGADLFKKITLVKINVARPPEEKETSLKPPVQFEIESTLHLNRLFPGKIYGEIWQAMISTPKDA